jgi:hypothetical protein
MARLNSGGTIGQGVDKAKLKEPLFNLRIMAYCAFDSRATVWTGN